MRQAAVLACLICIAASARADYWPQSDPRSGGMRDLMLLYLEGGAVAVDDLMPYVAYLDKQQDGRPVDWFYDSFLFLLGGCRTPSGQTVNFMAGATTRSDWEHYLNILFDRNRNLHALDEAVSRAAVTLGPRPQKVPVILMIPYPCSGQKDFGTVEPGGRSLDLSKPQDTGLAAGWLADEAARRFREANYANLTLWGYYWMNESIAKADEEKVKATARAVHERKSGLCWIPCSDARSREKWRELGFDFAVLQPNYAFQDYGLPGPQDEQRLSDTAAECRKGQMGIEIETWDGVLVNAEDRTSLTDYLNHGLPAYDGYMKALHGYYVQDTVVRDLYRSDLPANNQLYRDLYEFCKQTYTGRDYSVARGQVCRVESRGAVPRMTMALTGEAPAPPTEAALIPGGGGRIVVGFPAERRVAQVRMRVRPGRGTPDAEFQAKISLWDEAGGVERCVDQITTPTFEPGEAGARWITGRWRGQLGRALMVDLQGPADASLVIDQIRVLPPVGPDGDKPYLTTGVGAAGVLTDMQLASGPQDATGLLQWPSGQGTITFQPPADRNMGRLWLHAIKPPGGQWPARVEVTCGGKTLTVQVGPLEDEWAAYIPVQLPVTRGRRVEVALSGETPGRAIALDEAEFELWGNLALDKPYTYEPPPARPSWNYPDDGRKLTDGALADTFTDRKLAGWINSKPRVVLDLGRALPVERVRVHAWGGGIADTWFPRSVTIWTSDDGVEWQPSPQRILPPPEPPEAKTNSRLWLEARVNAQAARYVRLDLVAKEFLLLDEIEVIGDGVNVVAGKPYRSIAPAPPRQAGQYPDDGRKLTDGRYSAPYVEPERGVGYPDVDPTVTVDLQQPCKLTLASVHACVGEFFGAYYPAETTVRTSLDGATWSPPIVLTNQREERGHGGVGLIETPLDTTARYVRWHFKRHGMCLIDEVEVYGE